MNCKELKSIHSDSSELQHSQVLIQLSPSFLWLNRTLCGIKHGSTSYLEKMKNNSAEKEGFPYAPDRLCSMHYDTGSYSAGCKEKMDVDEAVL